VKNNLLFLIKSKLNLNIKGPNIERFIKRLKNNNIEILNITHINTDEVNIKIYKYDYDNVLKLKTIYEIDILNYYGVVKLRNNIFDNKYVIIFILIALIFLYVITNMIFNIDIITNDSKMEKTLIYELEELGVKKYNFKKNYDRLQEIKKIILSNHKDELEWLEIESIGTKYIVRYEPRIKNIEKEEKKLSNIIAKKDAVIKSLNVSSGQIVKGINSYVKKGEVIVSGYIDLNGNIKDTVSSNGTIYGEVWYKVTVSYPYKYKEVKYTGNKNKVLVIKLLDKNIELFNFNHYKTKEIKDRTILKNNILPIKFVYQEQRETIVIDENNNEEELINKAIDVSKNKIEEKLKDNEYISDYKILSKTLYTDSITLNIFFTVVEDITEYQEIEKYEDEIVE
jgi:similar to stage IV sporulation protein